MSCRTILAALALTALPVAALVQTAGTNFRDMALPEETPEECAAPRPPRDLAKTAYIRNAYRAILRILAVRHWQETGDCSCMVHEITWEEVVARSEEFATSDHPLLPFDTAALRLMGDALEAERAAACEAG